MGKKKLLELEKFILAESSCIEYPQTYERLLCIWDDMIDSGKTTLKVQINTEQKEKIKTCTFPIILKQNSISIKSNLRDVSLSYLANSFKCCLVLASFEEFCLFLENDLAVYEKLLNCSLSELQGMNQNLEKLKQKFLDFYLKQLEKLLYKESNELTDKYKENLIEIFWPFENSLVLDEILQKPRTMQQLEFNDLLIKTCDEIKKRKETVMPSFPLKVFNKYLEFFLKSYKREWKSKISTRDKLIERSFIEHSNLFIHDIHSKSLSLFDGSICSTELKQCAFLIILSLLPVHLSPTDQKIQSLNTFLNPAAFPVNQIRDLGSLNSILTSFWTISEERSRNFIVFCTAFIICFGENYTSSHRELLQSFISNTLFSFSVKATNSSLLLYLETLIPKYYSNFISSPSIIYIESSTNSIIDKLTSTKKKSLKLINIFQTPSLSSAIIVPGSHEGLQKTIEKFKDFLIVPHQSESYVYKWNPSDNRNALTSAVPNFMLAGFSAYQGNLISALQYGLNSILSFDFKANKIQAKLAGQKLAQCISNDRYLKMKPICLVGFEAGCDVVYYCLKEISRLNLQVHQVYLFNHCKERNWTVYSSQVEGRFVNCYSGKFNAASLLKLKSPLRHGKISGPKVENVLVDSSKTLSEILKIIEF